MSVTTNKIQTGDAALDKHTSALIKDLSMRGIKLDLDSFAFRNPPVNNTYWEVTGHTNRTFTELPADTPIKFVGRNTVIDCVKYGFELRRNGLDEAPQNGRAAYYWVSASLPEQYVKPAPKPAPATKTERSENLPAVSATVPVEDLVPNPWQPRKLFDVSKLVELAEDIRINGLMQPVVVRELPYWWASSHPDADSKGRIYQQPTPHGNLKPDGYIYQIAAGERRWRAYNLLKNGYEFSGPAMLDGETDEIILGDAASSAAATTGSDSSTADSGEHVAVTLRGAPDSRFEHIPVLVNQYSDELMMRVAYSENAKRVGVSPLEEAIAFQRMINDLGGITQTEFAKKFGISQATVANRFRMLNLPDAARSLMLQGKLGARQALQLLTWKNKYELKPAFVEALAFAMGSTATMSSNDVKKALYYLEQGDDNFALNYIPGILDVAYSNPKFDFRKICAGCEFSHGDVASSYRKFFCAKPAHFNELNEKEPKEKAELAKQALKQNVAQTKEIFGEDVARRPNGVPLQDKPEKDESGVSVITDEKLKDFSQWEHYKSFSDWNGFDRSECTGCQFYLRVRELPNEKRNVASGLTKSYVCFKPSHFEKLSKQHTENKEAERQAKLDQTAAEFNQGYAANTLLGFTGGNRSMKLGVIDKPTARLLARNILVSVFVDNFTSNGIFVAKANEWLEAHGLRPGVEELSYSYASCATLPWIDEELDRLKESDDDYLAVVKQAVALATHLMLVCGAIKQGGRNKSAIEFGFFIEQATAEKKIQG